MKLRCINIVSQSPQSLTAFYEQVFSAKAAERTPGRWELRVGDIFLVFTPTCEKVIVPTESCGLEFEVGDVDGEYKRLLDAGIEVAAPPVTYPWKWRAFAVKDPDGNNLDFVQYVGEVPETT